MSIYETREAAIENKDVEAYLDTLHEDFIFVSHIDSKEINRADACEMFTMLMTNDNFVTHESRCLYENDDVIVEHGVMSFPDGSREAVLSFHEKKDGKVVRMETGASVLS